MIFLYKSKNIFVIGLYFASTLLFAAANANVCSLDYSIMYLIAANERHPKRPIGYPYQISLNNKKDYEKVKHLKKLGFIDNRTIDCKNLKNCTETAKFLLSKHIDNLDMGGFQINYKCHKFELEDYFNFSKSYMRSCQIAQKYINKDNVTFEDIAKYHSFTRKHNKTYAKNLKKII